MDFERARYIMVEQQVRPWNVLDQRVLDVMLTVPREAFVPERYRNLACADVRIPIGHGQTTMTPNVEGRLLQAMDIRDTDSVLEVGTGSGYLCACLARLAHQVHSVDIVPSFVERAGVILADWGIANAALFCGDAARDWGDRRFDVIVLTGALYQLFDSWRLRLAIGGRLFAIVGQPPAMEALRVVRSDEDAFEAESLFETDIDYLQGGEPPRAFQF